MGFNSGFKGLIEINFSSHATGMLIRVWGKFHNVSGRFLLSSRWIKNEKVTLLCLYICTWDYRLSSLLPCINSKLFIIFVVSGIGTFKELFISSFNSNRIIVLKILKFLFCLTMSLYSQYHDCVTCYSVALHVTQ